MYEPGLKCTFLQLGGVSKLKLINGVFGSILTIQHSRYFMLYDPELDADSGEWPNFSETNFV